MPGRLRTRTWEYRKARAAVLARHPVCQACFVADSQETDHVTPFDDGGSDDESNLVALCSECHKVRTRDQRR